MSYITLPMFYYKSPVPTAAALPDTDKLGAVRLALDSGLLYWFDGANWQLIPGALSGGSVSDTDSIDLSVSGGGVLSGVVRLSGNTADANNTIVALNVESTSSVGIRAQIANANVRALFSGTAPVAYNSGTGAFSMAAATSLNNGYLTSADWTTFNSKVSASRSISTTAPLTGGGDLSADRTFGITQATTSTDGYLSSTDWDTFNDKEPAITAGTTAQYWRGDKTFQTLNVAALQAVTGGGSASAGTIGEILTGTQATNTDSNVAASGSWGFATSVSLTAGVWQVQGNAGFDSNGAILTTALECGISASTTGSGIDEFNTSVSPFILSAASDALIPTPVVYISISSTTTYYLNTRFYYTLGTPQHRGRIQALRIR